MSFMPAVMEAIEKMTHEEKLHAMDMLWTSIIASSGEFEPPVWHEAVLNERRRQIESGEAHFIPWEDAKRELRQEFA